MLRSQMSERCPSSDYVGNATLGGFRLGFPITSARIVVGWVWPAFSSRLRLISWEGVVYTLSKEDVLTLDRFESLGTQYSREWGYVDIQQSNGSTLSGEKSFITLPFQMVRNTIVLPPNINIVSCKGPRNMVSVNTTLPF